MRYEGIVNDQIYCLLNSEKKDFQDFKKIRSLSDALKIMKNNFPNHIKFEGYLILQYNITCSEV